MELRHHALQALLCPDFEQKTAYAGVIASSIAMYSIADGALDEPAGLPGRPALPVLVEHLKVPKRSPFTREGLGALLHAVADIGLSTIKVAFSISTKFRPYLNGGQDAY